MKIRVKVLFVIATVMGLSLLISQLMMSNAQEGNKTQETVKEQSKSKKKDRFGLGEQTEEEALEEVTKSAVGGFFHNTLTAKESEWILKRAIYSGRRFHENGPLSVSMSYQKGDVTVGIGFLEFNTSKDAERVYQVPKSRPGKRSKDYGDESEYGLSTLSFRKGNFFVEIVCSDEKTARQFAVQALEVVSNFAK